MRKPVIVGNWKMNMTVSEAKSLLEEIKEKDLDQEVEAGVCTPAVDLPIAAELLEGTDINFGGENMYYEESGAFTGEISPLMLTDIGADYVILGHSERRDIFGEDDKLINEKVLSAFSHDLTPILCCGESLEEREANKQEEKVKAQLTADLADVSEEDIKKLIIAYEPIWAIGTGKTASAEDAEAMCAFIRNLIAELYSEDAAEAVRIQYGGSVKPANVKELMAKENIDGALVGGASLKADDFADLVNHRK
ncbi:MULTISPECIES: triose-phosphate isomerase [Anaerococcus]|mgnify:FL=1|uniref:Triosephosphate isomerase n=2 Tax=Anaerococcus TaxID=165779 RepID=A0A3E2TID5_9FIRM|nr:MULTISPECIES: triose-phosphate isomerase [Anaerococcus]MDU1864736.1 triose-phosphate isomerase [Anaerococcus sp.]MDU2354113.1 triose-phosphate isomerase [Anaerococcus sp.]MDU2565475.1 triose-phosphate isomerase [Anaerococcus sp.]MDU3211194.1 triose-phosphate isomerase [Anaerococcus sp.]RGB76450.1 triose-phosphate isomerase [Anaerococcus nagyae]